MTQNGVLKGTIMEGNQPAARGRLGREINAKLPEVPYHGPLNLLACHVNASLTEGGELTLSVNGRAEYAEGSHVGGTIELDEVPQDLIDNLKKALEAVLEECHNDLKEELERESELAFRQDVGRRLRMIKSDEGAK